MTDQPPTLANDLLDRAQAAEQDRDALRAELEEIRHHLAKAISTRQDAERRLADAGVPGSSRRAQDGWDPSSPQHAVIRAAISWRAKIADAVERGGAPPRVWADDQDLALIAAVDELPHIGAGLDWHGLRCVAERAIRDRVAAAWPALPEDDRVFFEQLTAEAASAAVGVPQLQVTAAMLATERGAVPPPQAPTNTEETAEAAATRFARELEQAQRDLLNTRYELRCTSAAEDEARERAEELGTALTIAHRHLRALDATSRYGVALTSFDGRIVVFGFPAQEPALDTGRVLADALAAHQGVRVDATLIEPAKLGDPPVVDVQALLEETRRALAAAETDADREEAVEELLEGWYLAWPDTALVSPHQPLAGELVRLLQPGPVTLTIPADLWAGLADRIKAGHDPELSIVHESSTTNP